MTKYDSPVLAKEKSVSVFTFSPTWIISIFLKISNEDTSKVLQVIVFVLGCLLEGKLWPFFPCMYLWYVFVACVQMCVQAHG